MPDHGAMQVLNAPMCSSGHAGMVGSTSAANPIFPPASYAPPITPDALLEAAMEWAALPFPHGRDKTAMRLGINYASGLWLYLNESRLIFSCTWSCATRRYFHGFRPSVLLNSVA